MLNNTEEIEARVAVAILGILSEVPRVSTVDLCVKIGALDADRRKVVEAALMDLDDAGEITRFGGKWHRCGTATATKIAKIREGNASRA